MFFHDDYHGASAKATNPMSESTNFKYTKDERWAAQIKLDELHLKQKGDIGLTEAEVQMKLLLHEVLNAEK